MAALPPSTEAVQSRVTVADTQQVEQRVTPPSHLNLGSLTVTFASSGDVSNVMTAQADVASDEVEQAFRFHAERWYMDTMPLSSYIEKILHPSYQRILVLGMRAVPLIMNELRDMPNDWFWALRIITEQDPVDPSIAGRLDLMAKAWLNWWEKDGKAWYAGNVLGY